MNNHSLQNTEEPIAAETAAAAPVAHRRNSFPRRPKPLYTEKHKVCAPAFPAKQAPCNIHAAITLRSATKVNKRIEARTHEKPRTQRRNRSRSKRPQPHPSHTGAAEATLHGKTRGFVLRLSPPHKPHATFMISTLTVTASFFLSVVSHF